MQSTLSRILAGKERILKRPVVSTPGRDRTLGIKLPLRILLAEDNIVNQRVAVRMLQRLGYSADIVVNGFQAIEAVHKRAYDLVLMDVQMPEMDGLETSRQIGAQLPPEDRPTIIAMTANAMQQDLEDCLAAGMNGFLCKPVQLNDLQTTLERLGLEKYGSICELQNSL